MHIDDDYDVTDVPLDVLRNMTMTQRFSLTVELTEAYIARKKQAIATANPGATQRELNDIFIRTYYGEELADEVKAFLEARDASSSP